MSNPEARAIEAPWRRQIRLALLASVVVMALIYALSGLRVIKPGEQALVVRFGKLTQTPLLPGTHYVLPYPVDRVLVFRPNEVKDVSVGVSDRLANTPVNAGSPSYRGVNVGPEFLTGDENIIHLEMNVQYQIGDPAAYLLRGVDPGRLIVIACEEALTHKAAHTPVDAILTSGRQLLLADVKRDAQQRLDAMGSGVLLVSVNMAHSAPPMEVADAFKDVASALEDRDRYVNEANGEQNEALPMARGEAAGVLQTAEADRNGKIKRAQGEAARFLRQLEEVRAGDNPDLAMLRLYLETLEQVFPRLRKYVVDAAAP